MRTPISNAMADRLAEGLDTAAMLGAHAAKLSLRQEESIGCEFEAGRLKNASAHQGLDYGVTVLVDGRLGSASGNVMDDLDEMIRRSVAMAKVGSTAHFDAWPAPQELPEVKLHSPAAAELPRERLVEGCQTIADALRGVDADLYIHASAGRRETERVLVTSGGMRHRQATTVWHLGSYVQRTDETDMLFAGRERRWRDVNELFDPSWIAEQIAGDLHDGRSIGEAPEGKVTAVIVPELLSLLLQGVAMGVNGRSVAKGDSPLAGRLEQKVLHEGITITDDPHTDFAYGSAVMDRDGVPTRVLPVFEDGVLRNFLYDLDSAGLAGAQPTGHPGCRPHHLVIKPGQKTSEELIAEIEDGILLRMLIGFGQSNLINGDFAGNVALGYRIRGGKLDGRLKNVMVSGNLYDVLARDVRLSAETDPCLRLPWAVIDGVTCSSARG